jgi:hypothetical protein
MATTETTKDWEARMSKDRWHKRCQELNGLADRPGTYSVSSNNRLFVFIDNVPHAVDWNGNVLHPWTSADQSAPAM